MIRFNHAHWQLRENEVMIRLSPTALDRAFKATNPEQYQHRPGRVSSFFEPILDDDGVQVRVQAPRIGAADGVIMFENGRHRALAAKLAGLKLMPVAIDRDEVTELRRLLALSAPGSGKDNYSPTQRPRTKEKEMTKVKDMTNVEREMPEETRNLLTALRSLGVKDDVIAAAVERVSVATFAGYCMGSCHGDWARVTIEMHDKVLRGDPECFEFYRQQWYDDEHRRREHLREFKTEGRLLKNGDF